MSSEISGYPSPKAHVAVVLFTDVIGGLVQRMLAISDELPNLADRRAAALNTVAQLVDADAGYWSWGRGWPNAGSVTPLAMIPFGFTDEQLKCAIEAVAELNIRHRTTDPVRDTSNVTLLREDLFADDEWNAMPLMRTQLMKAGFGGWLHSVHYSAEDTWSSFFLLRNTRKPDFDRRAAQIVDFTMTNVMWFHSTAAETPPADSFTGLKPRQRTVMLMLLDGHSRKKIASQLGIVEDTVGDHIKAIYRHFEVNSVAKLASLFLRGK